MKRVSMVLFLVATHPQMALAYSPEVGATQLVPTPGVVAVEAAAPAVLAAVKDSGGSVVTTAVESATKTETTTSVVTTPATSSAPSVVQATTTIVQEKTPHDMVGWAGGAFHGIPQALAGFAIFMAMVKAAAQVLNEMAIFLYTLARLTKKPRIKQDIEMVAWALSILAWIVSIFGAGSPQQFASPNYQPPAHPERPNI